MYTSNFNALPSRFQSYALSHFRILYGRVSKSRSKEIGLYSLLNYSKIDGGCLVVFCSIVASTVVCVLLSLRRYLVPATALFCLTLYLSSYYLVSVSVIECAIVEFQSFGFNFHESSTYSEMKQLSIILLVFSIVHYIAMCFVPARYRSCVCQNQNTAGLLRLLVKFKIQDASAVETLPLQFFVK